MDGLQVFSRPEFGNIRTLTIEGAPWFVGKDIAAALGYKDSVNALKSHVDDEDKRGWRVTTPSGEQQANIINESGLYSLILSSKLPAAKQFKRWVTSEVLPALRKTGQYQIVPEPEPGQEATRALTTDDYITAAQIVSRCRSDRLPIVLTLLDRGGFDTALIPQATHRTEHRRPGRALLPVANPDNDEVIAVLSHYGVREAAELTGLNPGLISVYRRGIRKPPAEQREHILVVLS
jgi:prophage antirepressor-like protein